MAKRSYDPFDGMITSRRASVPKPSVAPAGGPAAAQKPRKKSLNIRLDPELLEWARRAAAANRTTVTALITQGLVYRLSNPDLFGGVEGRGDYDQ